MLSAHSRLLDTSSPEMYTNPIIDEEEKCEYELKQDLKEMKGELEQLNEFIERVSKDLDKANVEKFKLDLKLKQMENKYGDKKRVQSACTIC